MTQDQTPSLRFPEFRGAWEMKRLGDVLDKKSSTIAANTLENIEGVYPIYGASGLLKNINFYDEEKQYIAIIKDGAGVGRLMLCPPKSSVLGTLDKLHAKTSNNLHFLYYFCCSQVPFKNYIIGSTIPHIYFKDYAKNKIQVPPLAEQEKIAECLLSLDEVITIHGDRLDRLKDYKTGLMQQLFPAKGQTTPALRFPEFRGKDPWEVKRLAEVCEINPSTKKLPEDFFYIDLGAVNSGNLISKKKLHCDSAPSRAQRLLKSGDIIYQVVRPYQRNNFLCNFDDKDNYVASTGYAQLRALDSNNFLYQLIHTDSFVNIVISKCKGSNYPAISSSDLSEINISIPPLAEQQKIADCLFSLDQAITVQEQIIKTLKHHKNGLMQQLFPKL